MNTTINRLFLFMMLVILGSDFMKSATEPGLLPTSAHFWVTTFGGVCCGVWAVYELVMWVYSLARRVRIATEDRA